MVVWALFQLFLWLRFGVERVEGFGWITVVQGKGLGFIAVFRKFCLGFEFG